MMIRDGLIWKRSVSMEFGRDRFLAWSCTGAGRCCDGFWPWRLESAMLVWRRGGSGIGNAGSAELPWMHRERVIESAIFWVAKYILKNAQLRKGEKGKGTVREDLGSLSRGAYLVMRLATSIRSSEPKQGPWRPNSCSINRTLTVVYLYMTAITMGAAKLEE